MFDITGTIITIIVVVVGFTLIYRILPFKKFENKKPKFCLFPKYVSNFDKTVASIESALEKLEFQMVDARTFTRGKVYGDLSAKSIKLTVKIDEEEKKMLVYASFFGILFDTGDIWQVTSDIVN